MELVHKVDFEDVFAYFSSLGPFDEEDVKKSLADYKNFYLVRLAEEDFWYLVFLANTEVRSIVPHNKNRQLRVVAARALALKQRRMSSNWDLDEIHDRFHDFLRKHPLSYFFPLILRDLRDGELKYHPAKYIHDGCHRSLGLAMAILSDEIEYESIDAYLCTNDNLEHPVE